MLKGYVALARLRDNDYAGALAMLIEEEASLPHDARRWVCLAEAHAELGNIDVCAQQLNRPSREMLGNGLMRIGKNAQHRGGAQARLDMMEQLRASDVVHARLDFEAGQAHQQLGAFEQAARGFDRAFAQEPTNVEYQAAATVLAVTANAGRAFRYLFGWL